MWEAPVWSGGRRNKPEPALFSEGKERQDRVNRLGLAGLNNSGMLWEGVVPRCLLPGLGLIQGRENTGLVCEGLIKGDGWLGYGLWTRPFAYEKCAPG